jgi:hypothetical protein
MRVVVQLLIRNAKIMKIALFIRNHAAKTPLYEYNHEFYEYYSNINYIEKQSSIASN